MFTFDIDIERDSTKSIVSQKEIKKQEEKIDSYNLVKNIKIKTKEKILIIDTIGELKKYINSIKDIEKLEKYLDDTDYVYLYKWMQYKIYKYI